MKQLTYSLLVFLLIGLTSCGNEKTEDAPTEDTAIDLKDFEELDLSRWGFNISLMVPNSDENGSPQITLTEMGSIQVVVGSGFGIEIMYGEGDIELLKTDLKEDLVFSSEILKEEKNALIYTQDIPNSGVKTQNHFFYTTKLNADTYEVRDLMEGVYGEGMIEKMLAAAKSIKVIETTHKAAV